MADSEIGAPTIETLLGPRAHTWYWELLVRLFREKPLGAFGGVLVLILVFTAIFANVLAPYRYTEIHPADMLSPYSSSYILGTDELGRDLLSRILHGARVSIYVGLGAVGISLTMATLVGTVSGYFGGKLDLLLQRVVDAIMAFPSLVILLSIMSILGTGLINVILALGFLWTFQNSRVVRGAALAVKEHQYIEAARAVGASHGRVLLRYILPNILAPIIILATLGFGEAILVEASLSFLGLGVPPPHPSWGQMLSGTGREWMYSAPWLALWPGVAISAAVFGFNMLGDALRDLLDPRLGGGRGPLGRLR